MRSLILFLFFFPCLALSSVCVDLLNKEITSDQIENYIKSYLIKGVQLENGESNLPPLVKIDTNSAKSIKFVLSPIYRVPFALEFRNNPNFWRRLSPKQKKEFLKIVRRVFQKNQFSEHDEGMVRNLFWESLGIDKEMLSSHVNEAYNVQWQRRLGKYPKWIPKWLKRYFTFNEVLKNPSLITSLNDYYKELLLSENYKGPFQALSPRLQFSLANEGQNCVGVCRHANDQMRAVLMDLGVPHEDIRIGSGRMLIPVFGSSHAWTEIRIGEKWQISDATPDGGYISNFLDFFSLFNRFFYPVEPVFKDYVFYPFLTIVSGEEENKRQ